MNDTFTININASELVDAINNLVEALVGGVPQILCPTEPWKQEAPAAEHVPEPVRMKAEQDKVIADIRNKLAEDRAQDAVKEEPVEQAETTKTEAPAYTIEQVREAFGELSKAKGREVAKGILAELGVKSVSNLQPEQFVQAMQLVKEA